MVRKYSLFKKSAFTLIELIFAIVIIAISVMSLPMMTQATSKGIEANIVQEVIFATGAILNESTTYYWDTSSMEDTNSSGGYSRVINTTVGGIDECLGGGAPYRRVGHINRQCLDDNTTIQDSIGDSDSIEQAETDYSNDLILRGNAAAATYKDSYSATATVNSCKDGGCVQFGQENNNTNLKEIEIQVTPTGSANVLVILRAYVANIGEVEPEKRVF